MRNLVENVHAVQVLSGLDKTGSHLDFTFTEHHTGIVVLLVGLVISLGVSDLSLEVVVVLGFVLAHTIPEGPLSVGVDVHLDNTGLDGVSDVLNGGTRTTVEDEEHGLVLTSKLLLHVLLGVVKDDGAELDISWGVNTVNISEGGCASEGGAWDLGKLFVGVHDFLGLSVKTGRVDVTVVNTIFLSSGYTEFEFQKDVKLGELLHVFLADGNVLFEGFLGEVKHVRGEKRFAVFLVVFLVGGKETVHPWQPGLLAVVGVENNGDSVELGNLTNVLGSGNASSNGGFVVGVLERLSGNELTSSLGESDHDGTSVLGSGFHAGVDGVGSNNVDSWDGISLLLGVLEKVDEGLSGDDTRLDGSRQLLESLNSSETKHKQGKLIRWSRKCEVSKEKNSFCLIFFVAFRMLYVVPQILPWFR